MRHRLARALLGALACVFAASAALALDPPSPRPGTGSGSATTPGSGFAGASAPPRHAATGLVFPPAIGAARLERSTDFARVPGGNAALGVSYSYVVPGRVVVTVYVYDLGRRIPEGVATTAAAAELDDALAVIHEAARRTGRYRDLRTVQAPTTCPYGATVFRCATMAAISGSGAMPVLTKAMVTGYRQHFLKLRIDWRQNSPGDDAEVERVVQTLVGAILR